MANNKITEEHVKDIYKKFKDYYESNQEAFFDKTQKHIVEDIKKVIQKENKYIWNNASLTDYINDLIYMLKGQSFARTINRFSEKYLIDKICEDFSSELCSNAKESLRLHKEYYKSITNKNNTTKDIDINTDIRTELNVKNLIFYGAPGVGKTHNYQRLISMIEEGRSQSEIFKSISDNEDITLNGEVFKTIKNEERVEFVTFHQSYSYEDFIEGFRPNKSGKIELEDGIFKLIADKAKENLEDSTKSKDEVESKYTLTNLIDEFKLYIEDKLSSEGVFYLKGKSTIENIGKSSFSVGGSVSSEQKLAFNIIERDYDSFKKGDIKSYKDIKSTFESKSGIHGNAPYYFALYEKLKEFEKTNFSNSNKTKIEKIQKKNFYIVIDEINRGNISKIFGELITLIEEDKRDVYEVTLPYSKEKFSVPSNLHIIATMNSTDKSIATVDIALRRRFTFLKMQPKSELVKHQDAKELMQILNEHIGNTVGEDYKLGHSYFMKVQIDGDLEFVKDYKIKPLLEEYFYADEDNHKKALEILNQKKVEEKNE